MPQKYKKNLTLIEEGLGWLPLIFMSWFSVEPAVLCVLSSFFYSPQRHEEATAFFYPTKAAKPTKDFFSHHHNFNPNHLLCFLGALSGLVGLLQLPSRATAFFYPTKAAKPTKDFFLIIIISTPITYCAFLVCLVA